MFKIKFHKGLTENHWFEFSFDEQMANVGAEVGRSVNWKAKDKEYSRMAFERATELLMLTFNDSKNKSRQDELMLVRKKLVDWFSGSKIYKINDKYWDKYFYAFNYAARLKTIHA